MTIVEFVPADRLDELITPWRDLAHHAIEPNPFYLPEFTRHSFANAGNAGPNGILVVRDPSVQDGSALIGLWPLSFALPRIPGVPKFVSGMHNRFMSCNAPLVRAGREYEAVCGFLNWFEEAIGTLGTLQLSEMALDGPVWQEIEKVLEQRQQSWCIVEEFERPLLDVATDETADGYLQKLSGKKRQSLKRKWRQLSKLGELSCQRYTGSDLRPAMAEFLTMERQGWKGTAGTAMDQSDDTRSLATDVLCSSDYGVTHIEAIRLDDKAIAMSIHVAIEGHAFFFKPAFDESFSSFSPGQLLHLKTIEGLYQDRWAEKLDSAVMPHDQLSTIWREKKRIGHLLVATSNKVPSRLLNMTSSTIRAYTNSRSVAAQVYRRARRHINIGQQGLNT